MPATRFCFASHPSQCFEFGSKRASAILPHLPPADGRPFGRASRQRGNRQVSPTTGAPASGASLPCLFESLRGLRAPEFKPRGHHASRSASHEKCLTPSSTGPDHPAIKAFRHPTRDTRYPSRDTRLSSRDTKVFATQKCIMSKRNGLTVGYAGWACPVPRILRKAVGDMPVWRRNILEKYSGSSKPSSLAIDLTLIPAAPNICRASAMRRSKA